MFNPCALIPVYNHPDTIGQIVANLLELYLPVILIDDGSSENCHKVLKEIASNNDLITLVQLPENKGKGGAVKAGIEQAFKQGFSHGLQIDADGQHNLDDIPHFLQQAAIQPNILIAGNPIYDESVPKLRYYSRYLTHIWIWINTLSFTIKDAMCGFRIYPIAATNALIKSTTLGNRMDFDPELMVKWYWSGGHILQLPTAVRYPPQGISHFRGWEDNLLISKMHTKLFFGMLIRLPSLVSRQSQCAKVVTHVE